MRTVGKHWPHRAPRGDTQGFCGYCGVQWRMSQMRRDRSGVWACPDDIRGRDRVTLDEGNAMGAQETTGPKVIAPTGDFDRSGHHDKDNPESILGILATPARLQGDVERVSNFPLMTGWWTMRGVRTSDAAVHFVQGDTVFDTGVGKWLNESRTTEAHLEDKGALETGFPRGPEDVLTTRIGTRQDPFGQGSGNGNMHTEFANQFVPAFDGEKIIARGHAAEIPPPALISDLSNLLPAGTPTEGIAGTQPCFWVVMRLTNLQPTPGRVGTAVSFRDNRAEDLTRDFALTNRFPFTESVLALTADYTAGLGAESIEVPIAEIGDELRLFSGRMESDRLVFKISNREFTLPVFQGDSGRPTAVNYVEACRHLDMEMHEIVFTTNVPNAAQIARLERYFHLKFPTMATEFDNDI